MLESPGGTHFHARFQAMTLQVKRGLTCTAALKRGAANPEIGR
ncbi:hypothetical protein SF83666_c27170 [Sinorhizobium fredii CCBAU 83666]|nr:hypothetical protein SF83666_c27170 [Sinorhizobium fredii CCBAU 83666]